MVLENSEDLQKLSIRGLNADRLRTLYYVAKLQNVTMAADKLGICQSAVSKQIQLIEDELGVVVFHRRDRRFVLTHVGGKIFKLAEKVLFEIDGTLKSIKEEYAGMGGTLKILTFPSFASVMVPQFLKNLKRDLPTFDVQIQATYEDIYLPDEDVLIWGYMGNREEMEELPLYQETIGLYASEDYLKIFGTPETIADLSKHQLLALNEYFEGRYEHVNWILKVGIPGKGAHRIPYMRLPSHDALANAIVNGVGIGGIAHHHTMLMKNPKLIRVLPQFDLKSSWVCFTFNRFVDARERYLAFYEYLLKQIESEKYIFQ